jgi:alkyl sulfatase BDS1-like metallo-beta-lactamase superfamily hydrolase
VPLGYRDPVIARVRAALSARAVGVAAQDSTQSVLDRIVARQGGPANIDARAVRASSLPAARGSPTTRGGEAKMSAITASRHDRRGCMRGASPRSKSMLSALLGAVAACSCAIAPPEPDLTSKPASPATAAANEKLARTLPFADRRDFEDARRGFVATLPDAEVKTPEGRVVWSFSGYKFLEKDQAPATVNPSLWRQAQLNQHHGLFKVTERVYQVRAFDLSNMTIVEGDSGLIVIDPLTSTQTAKAALDLYWQHRPRKPVVAVMYTHSHVDHFGGVRGVVDEADVRAGRVKILAPRGFMEHAVAENVIAGNAMSRRAQFQFGAFLPPGERSQVDTGLGRTVPRGGAGISLIAPNDVIDKASDTRVVDGVQMVFQLTPGTEAPAEMNIYFPQFRLLNVAENVTHNMHNLYTIRGAEIRDAVAWSAYIEQARDLFGDKTDVLIAQHHWPRWGQASIDDLLAKQRDLYKYIHDQSVRLMNWGYTPREIAEQLRLPPSLENEWSARGYYGTLSHNAKAVYQKYLGWYDANPAHLNPLPPAESARRYVEYMGGASAVLERARRDLAGGDYRWVVEVVNQVVFADPQNMEARALAADAMEQLGYQSEAGTWRNAYLNAAAELRNGKPKVPAITTASPDVIRAISLPLFFDYLGVRLDPAKAEGKKMVVNWVFPDTQQQVRMKLENATLTHVMGKQAPNPDATITLDRATLDAITLKQKTFPQAAKEGAITIQGNAAKLQELLGMMDEFNPMFDVVTPNPPDCARGSTSPGCRPPAAKN